MARHFQGPNGPATYLAGNYTAIERPFVDLGSLVPAADPGTDIPNPVAGPAILFADVASANADHWLNLPAPIVGLEIYLYGGATGYELRSSDPATVAINGGTGAGAESAIAASLLLWCRCVSPTAWIVNNFAADGTEAAEEAAA